MKKKNYRNWMKIKIGKKMIKIRKKFSIQKSIWRMMIPTLSLKKTMKEGQSLRQPGRESPSTLRRRSRKTSRCEIIIKGKLRDRKKKPTKRKKEPSGKKRSPGKRRKG